MAREQFTVYFPEKTAKKIRRVAKKNDSSIYKLLQKIITDVITELDKE